MPETRRADDIDHDHPTWRNRLVMIQLNPMNGMLKLLMLASVGVGVAGGCVSCGPHSPDEQFIRQVIPVGIQKEKPVEIEIHSLSGTGQNLVGIRCSPEVWDVLTNASKPLEVRLKSSSKPRTEIGGVDFNTDATGFLKYLTNVHYLFWIKGESRTKASVEITFPNTPRGTTHAEIIVGKTPIDTKL